MRLEGNKSRKGVAIFNQEPKHIFHIPMRIYFNLNLLQCSEID